MTVITVDKWLDLVNYQVEEGSEYYIREKTYYMLSVNRSMIVFDHNTRKRRVLGVEFYDYENNRAYRTTYVQSFSENQEAWTYHNGVDKNAVVKFEEITAEEMVKLIAKRYNGV